MDNSWIDKQQHSVLIGVLLIFSFFILMFGNGIVSLTHPDEVFYIQSAKEMVEKGSWLTPYIFDGVQFEKPFLAFAMFAAAVKWMGLNSFAGRFFPSLFGIIGVGVIYGLTWILFKRKRTAFLSGIILSTSFIYMALSRAVLTDVIFSVFILIAMCFFCLAYYNRKYKNIGIILWLAVSGVSVLTKGLLGIVFPLAIVFIFLIYKKDFKFLWSKSFVWGTLIFIAIALPWHVLMYMNHGQWFLEEYFYNVHVRRLQMSEHARLDNWYFYLMLIIVGVMPWFLFWIPTFQTIYRQFNKKMANRGKIFLLLAWIAGVYIFVQPAHSKLASYIFPLFPAVAILLAYSINENLERLQNGEQSKLFKACGFIMSVILVGIAIGGIIAGKKYIHIILSMFPVYVAAGASVVIALLILIFNFKKKYVPMVFAHIGVSITLIAMLFYSRPYIEPWVSCKHISDIFNKIDQSNTTVLASKFYVRGIRYYTDRPMAVIDINGKGFWSPHPIPFLNKDQMVTKFFDERDVTWAVLKEGNVQDLKRILKPYKKKYKMTELDGIGGKYILKIEKLL